MMHSEYAWDMESLAARCQTEFSCIARRRKVRRIGLMRGSTSMTARYHSDNAETRHDE